MSSYYELFDFRSGNVMENFAEERDAWDALRQMAMEFGIDELHDLGLSYTHDGESTLIAMDDDLVRRVLQELSPEAVAGESRR
jgi:hypothetical protein